MVYLKDKQNRRTFSQTQQGKKKGIKYTKLEMKEAAITTVTIQIQSSMRETTKNNHTRKLDSAEEMDTFLKTHNLLRLNHEKNRKS